ncbi:MAG: hypothetical protein SAJ12_00655 [Jaaginema sp. PMC 1079.18]|nr:hypothetical protein [Jaaginema sp. PMC 1080.18]MEC4849493.1 hypothetical protein [Jaaginema sp. PMC 1079.18]MEC4866004.1 hypothetical protein [Jaaginema sp. PMC 1078.18]
MNSSVNRPDHLLRPSQPNVATESDSVRHHPIPPPSHPKQYRAIGLIQGCYTPAAEVLTQGTLKFDSEVEIPAVLLGKTLSLVKNHLDLTRSHLWVVYPRMRQNGENLHVQIAGVWEPEVLSPESLTESTATSSTLSPSDRPLLPIRDGVFSIRGEVVFSDPDAQKVVVRIQQAPRRASESAKDFKLALVGSLPIDRPLGHFWDFQTSLQGKILKIAQATKVGLIPPKKRAKGNSQQRSARNSKPQKVTSPQRLGRK